MKVKKIFISTTELELNITEATLLTIDEAKLLPERLKAYRNWWLKTPGSYSCYAAYVDYNGFIHSHGGYIRNNLNVVRPALIISNLESSEFKFGDRFEFGGKEFEIVFDYLAFCLTDIGQCAFKKDWNADDKNNYEQSDVKQFINEWFEKAKVRETEKTEEAMNSERIKQLTEAFAEWFIEFSKGK